MFFRPDPNDELILNGITYRIAEHPAAPGIPYGQEGRAGIVYQLLPSPSAGGAGLPSPLGRGGGGEGKVALKVFKPRFRTPALVALGARLNAYARLPGLRVCERMVLTPDQHGKLLKQHPDLTYAVLMPWIEGVTWFDVLQEKRALTPAQSLVIAASLCQILTTMEEHGLAHCDLSASNILLPVTADPAAECPLELVDVEQMYGLGLPRPQDISSGTAGYAPLGQNLELWSPQGDRFAGAILLGETLGWCDESVRQAAWGESYFEPVEMQQESRRYQILLQALERHWGKGVADLFERAWKSEVLADCPTFGEWKLALPESQPVAEAFKTNVAVEPTVPPAVVGGIEPPEVHPWAPVKSEGYEAAFRHAIEAYHRREWALARELLIPIVTESPNYNLEGYSARALLAEVERQARRRPVAGWVWGALGAFFTLCLVVGGAIAFLLSGALIPGLLGTQVPANSNTSSVLGNMPTYPVQPTYTFEWIPSSTPQNNHNPGVLVTPIDTIEPTQYNPVPLTGKIAFERRESNNTLEIFLMNPDGSGLLNLTQNSVDDVNPSWSPDGKSLVFHSYREDNLDLYRLEVDDRQVTRLTSDSAVDWYPSWSPEGRYIAFYSNRRERDYDIYLLNLSNLDEVIPVTSINGADAQPTWSPDGRQIVFQRHINGNWEIFVISIDGSGMANLTNHPADDKTPAFSPDGTKIAFMSERTGNPEIFVLDLLTGELVNLTNNPAQDRDPCWSPDGMYIIFETDRDGNWELYRIRADGSEVTRLTDYPNDDWGADWSD